MKPKVVRQRTIKIHVLGRNQTFSLKVDSNARILELANYLNRRLNLDHITTDWDFYTGTSCKYQLDMRSTLRQVEFEHGKLSKFFAKIGKMMQDKQENLTYRIKRMQLIEKQKQFYQRMEQKMSQAYSKKTKFKKVGDKKINFMFREEEMEVAKKLTREGLRQKVKYFDPKKIFPGLSIICLCRNPKCINSINPVMFYVGFGEFGLGEVNLYQDCDLCTHAESVAKPLKTVAFILRVLSCAREGRGG